MSKGPPPPPFFFQTKRGTSGLPQNAVINVFSLGNPTPPANEGGIDHLRRRGRCHEDGNPSVWERFTFFSPIVPEKAGRLRREGLEWRAAGGKHNKRLFSIGPSENWNERPAIHGYSRIFESIRNAMKAFVTNKAKVAPALAWTSS